jgi:2-polyprenyl-3-methyl-5-hydroxy-6-metoxy-1,4-benzoquinol methylase
MSLDSTTSWDLETRRNYWDQWHKREIRDTTILNEKLRRGETVISLLEACNLQRPNILELGCSNGWLAEKLAAFGPVTGADISDEAIEQARRRVPSARFYAGDVVDMDLPLQAFDVVITLGTITEVPNQRGFVELTARVLKPRGYLILVAANRTVYRRSSAWRPPAPGRFHRELTMRELRRMLLPYFHILKAFTIQPAGNRGFLRVVNSIKLNRLLAKIIPQTSIDRCKEKCGLGQTLIVVARKR